MDAKQQYFVRQNTPYIKDVKEICINGSKAQLNTEDDIIFIFLNNKKSFIVDLQKNRDHNDYYGHKILKLIGTPTLMYGKIEGMIRLLNKKASHFLFMEFIYNFICLVLI